MENNKVYIAGPEVFLPNMKEIREAKLEICALHNLHGIYPIDDNPLPKLNGKNLGHYICRSNKNKIKQCFAVIANITPFRSVSADAGTIFEIGYADALNRPIFAYTNNPLFFAWRCIEEFNGEAKG